MSDDEQQKVDVDGDLVSDSESNSDDGSDGSDAIETLIAGRSKRANAGNRMANLIEREEDDEVALLFAEVEGEEDVDFAEVAADDASDAVMDSDSDDDDQGPNAAVEDDLEGEKDLKRQEKAERTKKRKAQEAMTELAALRRKKRVKIDPSLPAKSSASGPRPKKKSERVSWLPENPDAPVRASSRKQTMANKEVTHARMISNEQKRQRLMARMRRAERDRIANKPKQLTQANRLAEAAKVEKKNAKSLNRWETMEKKRAEERQAKLDALHNRKLEGPVFTWWSGKAKWIGERLVMVGSTEVKIQPPKEYTGEKRGRKKKQVDPDPSTADPSKGNPMTSSRQTPGADVPTLSGSGNSSYAGPSDHDISKTGATIVGSAGTENLVNTAEQKKPTPGSLDKAESQKLSDSTTASLPKTEGFLEGIHEFASMPLEPAPASPSDTVTVEIKATSEPNVQATTDNTTSSTSNQAEVKQITEAGGATDATLDSETLGQRRQSSLSRTDLKVETDRDNSALTVQPSADHEAAPQSSSSHTNTPAPDILPQQTVAESLITEIPVDAPITVAPGVTATSEPPTAPELPAIPPTYSTRNLLVLNSFDNVTASAFPLLANLTKSSRAEKSTTKSSAKAAKQAAAPELCPITSKAAKFRDPETGIPYADSNAYKAIQAAKQGVYVWSEMLGCYVGKQGEVAKGVPKGFLKEEQSDNRLGENGTSIPSTPAASELKAS